MYWRHLDTPTGQKATVGLKRRGQVVSRSKSKDMDGGRQEMSETSSESDEGDTSQVVEDDSVVIVTSTPTPTPIQAFFARPLLPTATHLTVNTTLSMLLGKLGRK